ncbi:hypothetical protein SEA_CAMBIARE_49 [Mycobacterium phage Cambiare]|uniref:Uncharacterized protein n=1 Tax=Mycobacterium phage Cambiare TaxID=1647305 RepID=A0A0F6YQM7_9CAUD|nr:hypothetical protein AVT48_gp49 [Mycobacterium phage Cambiare]AKF14551.1 hypothetical protein SEA_CAMBIARE_49 [Mycobacterium phage Cambiare]
MTDQLFDDRAGAYVGAREALKAAQQIKVQARRDAIADPENGGYLPITLSDEYWALIAEAAILSNLARADAGVGIVSGHYLADQAQRIERNRRRRTREDVHAKLAEVRERTERGRPHPNTAPDPFDVRGLDPIRVIVTNPDSTHRDRTGVILQNELSAGREPRYLVSMLPGPTDQDGPRDAEHVWFDRSELDLVIGA